MLMIESLVVFCLVMNFVLGALVMIMFIMLNNLSSTITRMVTNEQLIQEILSKKFPILFNQPSQSNNDKMTSVEPQIRNPLVG